ncbi:MAG: CoA transferase, partial [Sciscionella sp.]
HMAVGAIEERFWAALLGVLELDAGELPNRHDPANWPALRERIAEAIATRTRDEWSERAAGTDACLTPVLTPWEAAAHPHNEARKTFVAVGGYTQPAPAPKFDRTPARPPTPPHEKGSDTSEVLAELGLSPEETDKLRADGVITP